jgi:hypothetical protein
MRHLTGGFVAAFLVLGASECREDAPSAPVAPLMPSTPAAPPAPPPANRPPTATIVDVQPPGVALAGATRVSFGGKGIDPDGDPLSFTWDFGDGERGVDAGVAHVYHREGVFDVTLTVTDGRGGSATAGASVTARKLTGRWRLTNAREILDATITQAPGRSSVFEGRVSDGSSFTGTVADARAVTLTYEPAGESCVPAETYVGEADLDVERVAFDGTGCRRLTLIRQ